MIYTRESCSWHFQKHNLPWILCWYPTRAVRFCGKSDDTLRVHNEARLWYKRADVYYRCGRGNMRARVWNRISKKHDERSINLVRATLTGLYVGLSIVSLYFVRRCPITLLSLRLDRHVTGSTVRSTRNGSYVELAFLIGCANSDNRFNNFRIQMRKLCWQEDRLNASYAV